MINLIILNSTVATSSLLLVKYFLSFDSLLDYLITSFILFLFQIILSLQLLGTLNILSLNNVFLLNFFILFIVYSTIRVRKIKSKVNLFFKIKTAINNLKFNKTEIFCLSAILGFGLVKILINLVNPPFGWDDLNYHFTFPVEWLKHSNLENPIVIMLDPSPTYYPINGSLFYLWFILPLQNVFIADLGQIPFFFIAFIAVYSLARKLNLSKEYSIYSASLFTLIPNYFKQLEIAYVDVIVATLFLISLNYILSLRRSFSSSNTVLCAISMGLLLGVKSLTLVFIILLILPILVIFIENFKKIMFKKWLFVFILFFISLILLGGFSYIRNFVVTGNPLYPIDVEIFGKVLFKGVIDKINYAAHFVTSDYALSKLLFHEGLGLQTIVFILPGIFLVLPVYLFKKQDKDYFFIYFFILPILIYYFFRYVIPLANVRYIYNLMALGIIFGFYVYRRFNIPLKVIKILVFLCVLASVSEFSGHVELLLSLFFWFTFFVFLMQSKNVKKIIITIILIVIIPALFILERDYINNEYNRYVSNSPFWPDATRAWEWLNEHTKGDNISYVGRPVPFPLYGTRFKNTVFYTSINNVDPAQLHYFKNSRLKWTYNFDSTYKNLEEPNNYRGNADEKTWLRNLKRRKADYLFVYSFHQTKDIQFPIEDDWASKEPDIFERVFANETIHIYKIKG